jgi:hypothetical protein
MVCDVPHPRLFKFAHFFEGCCLAEIFFLLDHSYFSASWSFAPIAAGSELLQEMCSFEQKSI